jgi:methionyl-tRNA synthetase
LGLCFAAGRDIINRIKEEQKMATIEDFKKIELKVGEIKEVNDHPNADKLYIIVVDLGDKTKQVVAGIKGSYQKKEELVGKQVVVVDNLDPAVLRGVESQGMILAASDESGIAVVGLERKIKLGSIVK